MKEKNLDEDLKMVELRDKEEDDIGEISTLSKNEILEELVSCYESICKEDETDNIDMFDSVLKRINILIDAYMNMPQEIKKDSPKMEERFKYGYIFSKLGCVDDRIVKGINDRYKDEKTILHNVASDDKRKDYVEAVVALIKMGANTTLRDINGKTPIDNIPEERINDVYQNLQKTLKRYEGKAVGLRLLRAIVEIEITRNKDYSNLKEYLNELESFVKNNHQTKKEKYMQNILSVHIFSDENRYIRNEREKYFLNKMKRNTNRIECIQNFFKSKNLDFDGLANKNVRMDDSVKELKEQYNKMLADYRNRKKENELISRYLLQKDRVLFSEMEQDPFCILYLLMHTKGVEVREYLELELKKIFLLHPTSMDLISCNEDEVINTMLNNIEFCVQYNNGYKKDIITKSKDNFDFNIKNARGLHLELKIKEDNQLNEKEREILDNIIKYIEKYHFKQIILKIDNIIKTRYYKIDDNVSHFLDDYFKYLLISQPGEVRELLGNLIERHDVLEVVIDANSESLLDFLIANGIDVNNYMVSGQLPIEFAIENEYETMVKALIEKGVDINKYTSAGQLPIELAIENENEAITKMLVAKGAKINTKICDLMKEKMPNMYETMNLSEYKEIEEINEEKTEQNQLKIKEKEVQVEKKGEKTELHDAAIKEDFERISNLLKDNKQRLNIKQCDSEGRRAIDYLLLDEILSGDTARDCDKKDIVNRMINMFDDSSYVKNVVYTACSNDKNPDLAIEWVLDALTYLKGDSQAIRTERLVESLLPSLNDNGEITALDVALQNKKISMDKLCELIQKSEMLKSDDKKVLVLERLIINDRKDIANQMNIKFEIDNEMKRNSEIGKQYNIEDFGLLDYVILKNKRDLYKAYIMKQEAVDIEEIKEKVITYNATNILKELLHQGEEFIKENYWKNATKDVMKLIIKHCKDEQIIEDVIVKAAKVLNSTMVSKTLKQTRKNIKGLLHIAVEKGSVELAKVVLDKYGETAFIQRNKNGKTAYDVALENCDIKMITYLIIRGAKVKYVEKSYDKLTEDERLLNERIKDVEERLKIARCNEEGYKEKLLKLTKEEINKKDLLGNTLLHYAIKMNNVETVKILISKGAEVNVRNNYNTSPLYLAIKNADKEIVENVLNNKAQIDEKVKGKSMLHYAIKRKIREDKDNKDKMEIKEKNSIALQLMEKGVVDLTPSTMNELVRVDRVFNNECMTQLMYYISQNNKEIAYRLINAPGINLNVEDDDKKTAYGYASSNGDRELEELIKAKEPNVKVDKKHIKNFLGLINTKELNEIIFNGTEIIVDSYYPGYSGALKEIKKVVIPKKEEERTKQEEDKYSGIGI